MPPIKIVSLNVAHRMLFRRITTRLCFPTYRPRPVPTLNPSLTRAKHDSVHSPAPPSPSRPQPDVQRPLPLETDSQPPLQSSELSTDDGLAGPAWKVPQQSSQTPTTDPRGASELSLPFVCDECGSKFRTEQGLHAHQETTKAGRAGQAGGCKDRISVSGKKVNPHVLRLQDPRDLEFTVGLGEKIFEKSSRELEPSTVAVTENSGYQVVSTFNARPEDVSPISVPGSAPLWKDPRLPIRLPQEFPEKIQPRDQNSEALSLLAMLYTQMTSSKFRYDQVDIVTHTGLLSKLLRLCKGQQVGTCRIFLTMMQGSLFLAHDPTSLPFSRSKHVSTRSTLRKHCTETPPGLEHSTHYRNVQYSLGHVNCVVQGKVDALCSIRPGELGPSSSPSPVGSVVNQEDHLQSEAALIQVRHDERHAKGARLGALWFSRAPLLLRARFSDDGSLTKVSKVDAIAVARRWEKQEENQIALRKLATLLSDLKRAVKAAAPDGQACLGLIERHLDPPTIQVFLAEDESKGLTEHFSNISRVGMTSNGPGEASEGGQDEPASESTTPQANKYDKVVQ